MSVEFDTQINETVKTTMRQSEDLFFWLVKNWMMARGIKIPIYTGKTYQEARDKFWCEDEEEGGMTLPCVAVDCINAPSNQELYDAAVSESAMVIALRRETRLENKDDLDNFLMELTQFLLNENLIDQLNEDPNVPYHGTFITHEISPPEFLNEFDGDCDVDLMQFIHHCQHYFPLTP